MKTHSIQIQHSFTTINDDIFNHLNPLIHNYYSTNIIVPHICNNIDIFGAGFAKAVGKLYPIVKDNYHMLGKSFLSKNLGYSQFVTTLEDKKTNSKLIFCNMIAQNGTLSAHNKRPINYLSLCKSMMMVKNFIQKLDSSGECRTEIHAPKFGSGLAGGNWGFISCLIDDIWGDTPVFIYDFKK